MKSIFSQTPGDCYLCNLKGLNQYHAYTEEHHIFFGNSNRKKSEKYGLKVNLCMYHHRGDITGNKEAVHNNSSQNKTLKRIAQEKWEETKSREQFIKEFGKSFL